MSGRVSLAPRDSERLVARRRRYRRRVRVAFGILALIILGAVVYGLWQPGVRISRIEVTNADASLVAMAEAAMRGTYFGIIPRNSIFFFPAPLIHKSILSAHTGIAAISLSRNGFTGLSIKANHRVPIAQWCGSSSTSTSPSISPRYEIIPTVSGHCYLFDASGFVYATATEAKGISAGAGQSGSNTPLTPFVLYSSLEVEDPSFIGATLKDANRLPAVFDFARQLGALRSPVSTVVIRADEVDFFLAGSPSSVATGPRITFLLGDEQNAFTALVSAKDKLNLSDTTLQYVDLRFPGKIYLKRQEPLK